MEMTVLRILPLKLAQSSTRPAQSRLTTVVSENTEIGMCGAVESTLPLLDSLVNYHHLLNLVISGGIRILWTMTFGSVEPILRTKQVYWLLTLSDLQAMDSTLEGSHNDPSCRWW
jgi:hypothetical protein